MAAPGFAPLRVVGVDRDTPESVLLTLDPGGDPAFRFAHGQYLTFRHEVDDIEIRRSYSICSTAPDGALRVGIKRVDGGAFSTWATSAVHEGDTLEAMPPMGSFTHDLAPDAARSYVLVAGGSGITPIYAIAATVLAAEPESRVTLSSSAPRATGRAITASRARVHISASTRAIGTSYCQHTSSLLSEFVVATLGQSRARRGRQGEPPVDV